MPATVLRRRQLRTRPPLARSVRALLLGAVLVPLAVVGPGAFAPAAATASSGTASSGTASSAVSAVASESVATRATTRNARIARAREIARNQIGDRYKYGAEGPRAFDCSGLVYFSTHKAGFNRVPRTSSEQATFMKRIKRSAMRRGDFVFFTGKSGVYHVGIFAGRSDGERHIVHAPSTGERVSRDPIWTDSWFPGTLRR